MGIKERVIERLERRPVEDVWDNIEVRDTIIEETLQELKKLIQSLRTDNPYPADIFTGKTEEGKIGQYGNKVWNNCLDEMEKQLGIKNG